MNHSVEVEAKRGFVTGGSSPSSGAKASPAPSRSWRTRQAYMSLGHLCGLVNRTYIYMGHAIDYLDTYLPPSTTRAPKSLRAQVLRNFLVTHQRFADAVAGNKEKLLPKCYTNLPIRSIASRVTFRLNCITTSILGLDHIYQAALDWNKVRSQASRAVYRFALTVPELTGCISLPTACTMPRHVLPIASGRRRRHIKKKQQSSRRRRTKAIIRALNSHRFEDSIAGSIDEATELLADSLDESLLAGVP